jgi:cysteine desulfurase / selenocysteine lyase
MSIFSKTELKKYREVFPHLQQPHYYLNHAAFGVISTEVIQSINRHLTERSSGVIESYFIDIEVVNKVRAKIARLINAPSVDNISFITNTSEGINLIAAGLPWQEGDHILLNDAEFPSNVYPYLNVRPYGVDVEFIKNKNGYVTANDIASNIKKSTKVVAVSAVQFLSGYKIDLLQVGEITRKNNTLLIVDGIQAAGNSSIDVQAMQIDGFISGGLKWLNAPMGTGFVYISDKLREMIQQKYVGWLSVETPWQLSNFEQNLNPTNLRYELGGINIPGIYALNASLDPFLELNTDRINRHLIGLTDMIDSLIEPIGLSRFTVSDQDYRTGIITYDLPDDSDGDDLIKTLKENKVTVSHRQGKIRFSPHYYNSEVDILEAMDIFCNVYKSKALNKI